MNEIKIIEIKEDIFAENIAAADGIRSELAANGTFFINVMSAPGSGKTTLLTALINMLKGEMKIGEMDVDIETDLDARRVSENTGIETIQIHNFGLCHIDADMTRRALMEYNTKGLDLLILENIGNLVCPAEFDTGAHKNVMLFSITEGDDKPLKYPLMFTNADVVFITKIDTAEYFDFDMEKAKERIWNLNPDAKIIPVSAKTGEGLDQAADWIRACVQEMRIR